MFRQSNAFFAMIIESIGRRLAPRKMMWCVVFGFWLVSVFVLRLMKLAPGWLVGLWLWSIPFVGVFALVAVLSHYKWFEKLSAADHAGAIERERAAQQELLLKKQQELIKERDKTRPDRR